MSRSVCRVLGFQLHQLLAHAGVGHHDWERGRAPRSWGRAKESQTWPHLAGERLRAPQQRQLLRRRRAHLPQRLGLGLGDSRNMSTALHMQNARAGAIKGITAHHGTPHAPCQRPRLPKIFTCSCMGSSAYTYHACWTSLFNLVSGCGVGMPPNIGRHMWFLVRCLMMDLPRHRGMYTYV